MTLEEINELLKKNNPYYQGSQAQKEEQAGRKIIGDDVIHTEQSQKLNNEYVSSLPTYNEAMTGQDWLPAYKKGLNYIGRKANTGIASGTIGIGQSVLTDIANNLRRGRNISNTDKLINAGKFIIGNNPIFRAIEQINNFTNEDKKKEQEQKKEEFNKKSILGKAISIGLDGISNIKDNSINYSQLNSALQILGNSNPEIYDKVMNLNNKISKPIQEIQEKQAKESEQYDNVTNVIADAGGIIGNMAPSIVASAVTKNPDIGLAVMGASAKGQATQEALNKGATLDEAVKIGDAKALVEVATEKISGGAKIFGKGSVDDIAEEFVKKGAKSKFGKFLLKQGYNIAGEITEEEISNIADNIIDKETLEPNKKIWDWNEAGQTAGQTALTTAILNGLTGGYIADYKDIKSQNNTNETQKRLENKENLTNNSNIVPSNINNSNSKNNFQIQKQTLPLNEQAQIKLDSKNFAKQIDDIERGVFPKNNTLVLLNKTPKVLQDIGLKDLPITLTQKHLSTIANEQGKYKNANYHNLGIDVVKQLPEAISNPLNIYKSSTKDDSIVLVTHLSDKKGNIVLASIKVDGKGTINGIVVDANHMTSAYGKNNYDYNIDKKTGEYKPGWADLNKDNMLYDIDDGIIQKNISSMARFQLPRYTTNVSTNNIIPQNENYARPSKKVLNPTEISNLTTNDVTTTPNLPNINYKTDNKLQSKFYDNLMSKSNMLNEDVRNLIKKQEDIKYYQGVTNEQSLSEAYNRLNKDGAKETMRWFSKDLSNKNVSISASEVAEGWILLKQYQDSGDYESAVNVAKRMRDMATKSGQALQAYNIQSRLTPEGMFQYAQSELQEAFDKFSKNKTQEWIDEHKSDFDLKPEETQAIIEKVKEAQELPDNSYEKKEKLAEINKILTDKLPPERGAGIKAWMRISMLFNPKTLGRNILGNAVIAPINAGGDVISSIADKMIAKKTGVRTIGISNPIQNAKGFKKGLFESYNDFKKGINTRDMEGNRFEIGEGKSFKNKGLGKALNKIDNILGFALDAGDRPFYEATFTNSINNQLVLNNTDIVTQDMIDIATNEALSRTWQDDNSYTKAVLNIRENLNKLVNIKGYGLGDVFIPFAKTPANLTKAIVDYSPIGMINTIIEGNNLRKAINRGDMTVQQQHKFVQDLGKATAGSMLYILGYALAKAGITTGESDEDKDVANFMKNNLGTSQYSIKIGDKTFTYDWAQPVGAPIAMMANLVGKKDENADTLNKVLDTLDVPMNMLLEQSFMSSIKDVFSNYKGLPQGIFEEIAGLPSRSVPTFLKQITDMTDNTQRTTYEKGKPIQTAINQVKAKVPGLSQQLTPVSNTLGKDVKKYGGETNPFLYAFHTFLNPANVNSNQKNKAGTEIYKVYQNTGNKNIFPRQADYSQTIDGNKITLTSQERYQYQKTSGKYYSEVVNEILKSSTYKKLSNQEKAKILEELSGDANEKAKEELAKNKKLEYDRPKTDVKIEELVKKGLDYSNAYIYKTQIKDIDGDKDTNDKTISNSSTSKKAKYIMDMDISDNQKDKLLSLLSDTDTIPTVSELKKLNGDYLTYLQQSGKKDDDGVSARDKYMMYIDAGIPVDTLNKYYNEIGKIEGTKGDNGKTISGSKKKALFNYINGLDLNITQKKILFTKCNSSYGKNYQSEIFQYINSLDISKQRKEQIWKELYN